MTERPHPTGRRRAPDRALLLELPSFSPAETVEIGRALGGELRGGETIGLVGELGGGKTTFTKGLASGLGLRASERVTSPTYVLEQVYEARVPIHHIDAYRLTGAGELRALGFEEHLGTEAVMVVEWADRVMSLLPGTALVIELGFGVRGSEEVTPSAREARRLRFWGREDVWGPVVRRLGRPERTLPDR